MDSLPALLDRVMPLSGAHRRDLPEAVHELSLLLTSERGGLAHPYWSAPRLTSAYLRYFLPWNLIRLLRLLPGLNLPAPRPDGLIADFGSGPLTFPLALWLAYPAWREMPLHVVAVDTSSQALELGRGLFRLAAPDSPWHIHLLRAPLYKAMREIRGHPSLITVGNVLNELVERGPERRADVPLAERMADLASDLSGLLEPGGTLCCVEPGTRLGGTLLEQLRAGALETGFTPLSPCTHDRACPLLERRGTGGGWCHAVMDATDAPTWLRTLAADSGLAKHSLSLAHLVVRREGAASSSIGQLAQPAQTVTPAATGVRDMRAMPGTPGSAPSHSGQEAARILSDAFAVPGLGLARYACTGQGLALIPASVALPQGSVVTVRPSQPPRTDAKSGARIMVAAQPGHGG